jgi:hypothetical protein
MTEREYDLLTAAPPPKGHKSVKEYSFATKLQTNNKESIRLRRLISGADPFIRGLFTADLIDLKLAALFGDRDKSAAAVTDLCVPLR